MTHQPYRAFVTSVPDITQHAHMPIFTNPLNPIPYIPICLSTSYPYIPARTRAQDTHIPTYPLNPYTLNFESYIYFLTLITLLFLLCQIAGTVQLGVQAWMFTNIEGMCDPHQKDHFIVCGFPLGVLDHG